MARKAGQGKEEEESRARQQAEKTQTAMKTRCRSYCNAVGPGGRRLEQSINNIELYKLYDYK
ncbi:hypothetical protein STEG23_011927, partial [Scotinomys teguina]